MAQPDIEQRMRRLPQQLRLARDNVARLEVAVPGALERARAKVVRLEARARAYLMFHLLQFPAASPPAGTARRADCPLQHPSRHPLSERPVAMQLDCTWVLNVHLDTGTHAVMVTATDRSARTIHFEPLELLTTAAVQAAVLKIVERHGRPHDIATDDSALWSGLGSAIGVPQLLSYEAGSEAWVATLAQAVAA